MLGQHCDYKRQAVAVYSCGDPQRRSLALRHSRVHATPPITITTSHQLQCNMQQCNINAPKKLKPSDTSIASLGLQTVSQLGSAMNALYIQMMLNSDRPEVLQTSVHEKQYNVTLYPMPVHLQGPGTESSGPPQLRRA